MEAEQPAVQNAKRRFNEGVRYRIQDCIGGRGKERERRGERDEKGVISSALVFFPFSPVLSLPSYTCCFLHVGVV